MLEIIYFALALLLGILAGIITGLLPGIHINLVSAFLVASSAFLLAFLSPVSIIIFIVAMTITHTFLDFIPSVFLGAPDDDSVLAVLPGHEMLLKGKGHEAIILTLYGGIIGIILILIFTPFFIYIFPKIYYYLKFIMFLALIFTNFYLILKDNNKLLALIVFLLSGFLGLSTLNLPVSQSLLPLLTGLFGSSSLITSIIKKQKVPKQKIIKLKKVKISKKEIFNSSIASILSAPLCAFLPALGTGQAAIIGSNIIGELNRRRFLLLLGTINTIIAGLSFITLYSIQEARTGTVVAIQSLLPNFTFSYLLIILAVILISGIISFFLALFISKIFARNIEKINYSRLSLIVLIFISIIVLIFSGFLGFLIFLIATATGLFAILSGARRTNMMGSLMMPAILLYFPL